MKIYDAVQTELSAGKSISQIKTDLKKQGFSSRAISVAISKCIQTELKKRNTSESKELTADGHSTSQNDVNKIRLYATVGVLVAIIILTSALFFLF